MSNVIKILDVETINNIFENFKANKSKTVSKEKAIEVFERIFNIWNQKHEWKNKIQNMLDDGPRSIPVINKIEDFEYFLNPSLWKQKLLYEWPSNGFIHGQYKRIYAKPKGIILHFCPGNGIGSSIWSIFNGILTGNQNIIKLSNKIPQVPILINDLLIEAGLPESQNIFIDWDINDKELNESLFGKIDGVVTWGSGSIIKRVRKEIPVGASFIELGPKLGLGILTKKCYDNKKELLGIMNGFALDICNYEQMGCDSLQCLLIEMTAHDIVQKKYENLIEKLGNALDKYNINNKAPKKSIDAQVEMYKVLSRAQLDKIENIGDYISGYPDWLVVWRNTPVLEASPLFRTVLVYPYNDKKDLYDALYKIKRYLQTVILACSDGERSDYIEKLFEVGVKRIVKPGQSTLSAEITNNGLLLVRELLNLVEDSTL